MKARSKKLITLVASAVLLTNGLYTSQAVKAAKKSSFQVEAKTAKLKSNKLEKPKKARKPQKRQAAPITRVGYRHPNELHLKPKLLFNLKGLPRHVVQKSYLQGHDLYSLQIANNNIVVSTTQVAAPKKRQTIDYHQNKHSDKVLEIIHGGHTQSWDYAGNGEWFVGATPGKDAYSGYTWTRDIGRAHFANGKFDNHSLVRLTDLNKASDDSAYQPDQVQRVEATVSPNHKYLLLTSIQNPITPAKGNTFDDARGKTTQNVHFALYDLDKVNAKLDQAENNGQRTISLKDLQPLAAFHLDNAYGLKAALPSFQGVAIDNQRNIYISSENPDINKHSLVPRQLIRIPWGESNPDKWVYADLNRPSWKYWLTEMESVQISGKNILFNLTLKNPKNDALKKSLIYVIPNFVK